MYFDWQPLAIKGLSALPQAQRASLFNPASLTQRLITASQGNFSVKRLSQGFAKPSLSEAKALNINPGQYVLVREVLLLCYGKPWVYARTVIPHHSLTGPLRHLRHLQNRSLGAWLFKQPSLKRSEFAWAALKPCDLPKGLAKDGPIYGRRSIFHLYNKPLLVAEMFLPHCQL